MKATDPNLPWKLLSLDTDSLKTRREPEGVTLRILVTGGCGFLGQAIVASLARAGHLVLAAHRSPAHPDASLGTCISGDYRDPKFAEYALAEADALIHFGSSAVPRTTTFDDHEVAQAVRTEANFLGQAIEAGVKKIVIASSGGTVYGDSTAHVPWRESDPIRPINAYGAVKAGSERALFDAVNGSEAIGVALRIGNAYGPSQLSKPRFGLIPTIAARMRNGEPVELWGADVTRDYIHAEDVADAVSRSLKYRGSSGPFNIGTGVGHTNREVLHLVQDYLDITATTIISDKPGTDAAWNVLDGSLARQELDFVATIDLESGVKNTLGSQHT
ncbi:MAG: NAD-dependent epimerase/dehydratase family protein [Candidatus Nanopelagicales bacterium]